MKYTPEFDNDDIENAYKALPDDQRAEIDRMAQQIENKIKARIRSNGQPIAFGRKQALELLAKLGIWMNANDPAPAQAVTESKAIL